LILLKGTDGFPIDKGDMKARRHCGATTSPTHAIDLKTSLLQTRKKTMRKALFAASSIVIAALTVSSASADEIGNPKLGLAYARANCAGCHAIQFNETESPNTDSPAFKAIADTAGMTRTALSVFLQSPHATMPNLIVGGEDADNLIAYILSLKGEGANAPR
jgi:mono/diheme cytochrome c family protein